LAIQYNVLTASKVIVIGVIVGDVAIALIMRPLHVNGVIKSIL
jgi:hypothetical protein